LPFIENEEKQETMTYIVSMIIQYVLIQIKLRKPLHRQDQ